MKQAKQVIVIMTDTQRYDMLGCCGNRDMKTPALDRLAREGVRFDRSYTCQPVCGPARAALFTGTWPHSNGSWANNLALGDNVRTIGQVLAGKGIYTAYIGKWHLDGFDYFGCGKCPDGWDPEYWYDMRCYLEELSPADRQKSRRFETCLDPGFTADLTYGHRCSNRAIDFLEKHHSGSFFLVISYDEPHHPSLCPAPFNTMYKDYTWPEQKNHRDTLRDKPEHHRVWAGGKGADKRPPVRAPALLGCNSFIDSEIGRVMEAVNRLAPDALVIFTSDHGDSLGAHGIWNKGPAMYDEITRIPFLVRWPGAAPANAVCPHPVSHIDVVPTILESFGLPAPVSLEGRSMLATFRDPAKKPNDAVFMEYGRYEVDHDGFGGFQSIRAVFDGRYKLVINLLTSDELYDLRDDPGEMVNLVESGDHAGIRDALHDRLLGWMNDSRDPFRGYCWERRPWRKNARVATWDYTGMTRQKDNDPHEPRQLDYGTGLEMKDPVRRK